MNIAQLYHTIFGRVKEVVGRERITRVRTMAWLQSGMLLNRAVHLTKIARSIPGKAKKLSIADRFRAFLNNGHVRVRQWYRPLAESLLCEALRTSGYVRLIIDSSQIGPSHQLLMVALAYRRRALPLAWTWVRSARGHSSGRKQCALLAYVRQLVPAHADVIVVGDSEFTPLQTVLAQWNWSYVLRQKGSHLLRRHGSERWHRCDSLVTHPGQRLWLTDIRLTQEHHHACNFLVLWVPGEQSPWLLATNLLTARHARLHYSRRMWIEEMFGDFKDHGLDLEASRLQHFLRLSRLTLAVSMLYVALMAFGAQTIKNGWRHFVDRRDRRDLSLFRIGFDMLERLLTNGLSVSIRLIPYFL